MAGLTSCEISIEVDFLDFEYTTLIKNRRLFYLINRRLYEWNWVDHISTSCFQEVLRSCGIIFYAEALFFLLEWRGCYLGPSKFQVNIPIFAHEDIILKDCGNLNAKWILVVKLKWRLFAQTAGKKGKLELRTKQASRRHKKSKPTTSFGGKGSLDSRSPGTPLSGASLLTISVPSISWNQPLTSPLWEIIESETSTFFSGRWTYFFILRYWFCP